MTKKEVQKRVLQNGKPLKKNKFTWCEKTSTFSSDENDLVINFSDVSFATQIAGHRAIQTAKSCANQIAYIGAIQTAGNYANQTAWNYANQKAEDNANQKAGPESKQTAGANSTCISAYLTKVNATGNNVVARRIDIFECVILNKGGSLQWCPYGIKGYIKDGIYSENGRKAEIVNGKLVYVGREDNLCEMLRKLDKIKDFINKGEIK